MNPEDMRLQTGEQQPTSPGDPDLLRQLQNRFADEELTPFEDGVIFDRVRSMQNPTTGRRYTLREGAALFGVNVGRFRSLAALCRPYHLPTDMKAGRLGLRTIPHGRGETCVSWYVRSVVE